MTVHTSDTGLEPAPPFRDPEQPLAQRVADLLSRLTLSEKIGMMTSEARAVPRLGIPAYNFWSEALHGVARNGRATVFPQAIGMAATWHPELIYRVASAIADEGRAKYHAALLRKGYTGIYQGLTFWSPNVNIFRDPRWGRGQETWGEDPHLTGEMAAAFVRGLQGDHPHYLKVAACAKHFAVHSGPEKQRHSFDARVSPRDLVGTYLPAFRKLVTECHVEAVMGAYNRVNGEPCCASHTLLDQTLRGQWGFAGHVVSDCWALTDIHAHHHVTRDAVETAAAALRAGCDLSCMCTYDHLGEAIDRGLIDEADLDRSLARTLATRFKLGMFDPADEVPYAATPMSVVGSDQHRQLAYEAALQSIVLLQNRQGVLPIDDRVQTICLVGPNAASADALLGNYHGASETLTTVLEGLVCRAPEGMRIEYRYGCPPTRPSENPINWSINEAAQADLTIACLGLSPLVEGEEGDTVYGHATGDRTEIELPRAQSDYVKQLVQGGAKVVVVLFGGSPIALGDIASMVEAVLYVWYPGQEGGRAIASVLFGDVAPSGKLPFTVPESTAQLPPFEDYSMAGRTYRFMTAEPLYPFGFGLSYTQFAYSDLVLPQSPLRAGESVVVGCSVANMGPVRGEEVVQLYVSDLMASVPVPQHSLAGFQRVGLEPGEHARLAFTLPPEALMLVDDDGTRRLEPGAFRITVGGCSPGPRGAVLGAADPVSGEIEVY